MPGTAWRLVGRMCCHVLNRGNGRNDVFHENEDYGA